jgi:hypothetical protein
MWGHQSASRAKVSSGPLKVLVVNCSRVKQATRESSRAGPFRIADILRLPGQVVADLLGGKIRLRRYGTEIQSTARGAGSAAQFGREKAWTNPVQIVLKTTFCSCARYWRTGVLYAAFASTAPPQSKLRRSCSGSGGAGTFAGNSCAGPSSDGPRQQALRCSRQDNPLCRSESRRFGNETNHIHGSEGAAAFWVSVLGTCHSASCDPVPLRKRRREPLTDLKCTCQIAACCRLSGQVGITVGRSAA